MGATIQPELLPLGTSEQYIAGDHSLRSFPAIPPEVTPSNVAHWQEAYDKLPRVTTAVINTPAWTNQPSIDITNNVFVLPGLATGNSGTLVENMPVDFLATGVLPTGFSVFDTAAIPSANFYYVNIVDAASGRFRLMNDYGTPASAITLTDAGAGWRLRKHVAGVTLGYGSLNDFEIYISGSAVNFNYIYINFTPFNSANYYAVSGVGSGYNGTVGFLFSPSLSSTARKIHIVDAAMRFRRETNGVIQATSVCTVAHSISGDPLAFSFAAGNNVGRYMSINPAVYPMTGVPISSITLFTGSNSNVQGFANGTCVTLREIR